MRYLFLVCFSFCVICASKAQLSEGGKPYSQVTTLKSTSITPEIKLKALDLQKLAMEDQNDPIKIRYGVFLDTMINVKKSGLVEQISGLGRMWRLEIKHENAKSLQLYFSKFNIPEGARLFVYDEKLKSISGGFSRRAMLSDGSLMLADFHGKSVIIEYDEPENAAFNGELIIGAIGQSYKDPLTAEAALDFVNINCPIGKDAQLIKHAVCKMTFRSGIYQATCSGALINNTKNDGTPYFLTANHCISKSAEATSLITYFNYEIEGCDGDTLTPSTLNGSKLLTTGQPSDFTLLQLNSVPPGSYQPYYAGWDVNDEPAMGVTGVHVPFEQTKKISIDHDSITDNDVSVTWNDNSKSPVGSHWVVGYDQGKTSGGSSGSPLFNNNNQIIGQLHGGDETMEFYGKLAYSWKYKPSSYLRISHYLDPDSLGITTQNGYIPEGNTPDAFLATSAENVCINSAIPFKDYSVFGPYQRSWTVTPSSYEFTDGTTDTSSNPVIIFHDNAVYNVSLNLLVGGSIVSTEKIPVTAGTDLVLDVVSDKTGELCACDFANIKLSGLGAYNYTWIMNRADSAKAFFTNSNGDTTTLVKNPDFYSNSTYSLTYKLVGNIGTCFDTTDFSITLLKPVNDDIANAVKLEYGRSDYYTNICASVEKNEPVPPYTSCTAQDSWCDEYGTGENIVENSVWFKFVADTGRVSISSNGFDNQIALYKADSYIDILNGNYVMVAANDDRSDSDFRPLIIGAQVNPGDTCWIQVDGSGGGLEDDFFVTISHYLSTPTVNIQSGELMVYPQPTRSLVTIKNPEWANSDARLKLYNAAGACIYDGTVSVSGSEISLDLSPYSDGIYVAHIQQNKIFNIVKIIRE